MKRSSLLCILAGLLQTAHVAAQATDNSPTQAERYLFVVNTASSMRHLSGASRQALFDLVHWGVGGHMQQGDTYGLWTFNSDVYPGRFPMQVWNPAQQIELASRPSLHLKEQPYEKTAQMAPAMEKMLSVIQKVKDVNVFIITDAQAPITATPFDADINGVCNGRRKEMLRSKKPFVIGLIARDGEIVDWSVTIAGDPVPMPDRLPLPAPSSVARPPATASTPAPSKPKDPPKPLGKIISMRGSASAPASTTTVSPAQPSTSDLTSTNLAVTAKPALVQIPIKQPEASGSPGLSSEAIQTVATSALPFSTIAPQPVQASFPSNTVNPDTAYVGPGIPEQSSSLPSPIPVHAREPEIQIRAPSQPLFTASPPLPAPIITPRQMFVAGGLLMLTAVGLASLLIRRRNPSSQPSLITRSIEQQSNSTRT